MADRGKLIFEANKNVLEAGDTGALAEFFLDGYSAHAGGRVHRGYAFISGFVTQLRNAIPDLAVQDVAVLSESGDYVTWQRTLSGTHTGKLIDVPPSGQPVEWREMVVSRFQAGRIAEEWVVSELWGELLSKAKQP